ncbi:DEAD/DEAH box helicase [Rufibacter sediminis]|uniref:DEAD/DEAH box helicase n=1 Tax=Rufibacter sediminis TaxID=2762756 RepID=A0ABR6VME3_9BACT|nr:type ISP restriction/modification enzyme [Rufibacter sediminis]MBC3538367.1 DEAD/DEAH box helicase [Rufibacter sediminis]
MSFQKILDKYRRVAFSERDKGERFERLMQAYLKTDPKYAYLFQKVWLWNEFPGRHDLGGGDTGIDLVALTLDGDYWAIQCKCYQENALIDKPAVDSFLSTSSREFKGEDLKSIRFTQRLWIDTIGKKWGSNAEEAIRNQNPPVTRLNLHDLREAPVDWEKLEQGIHGEAARAPKKELRAHQKKALGKTHEHFKDAERGKLIMACGTGKTFNSLRIAENETDGRGLILFLVPSISLLGQTLREWSADALEPINPICICSDPEITRKKTKNEDTDSFSVVDLALPASTNVKDILQQFRHIKENRKPGMTVVFSTYQSIEVIAQAQKQLLQTDIGFGVFDLIICDEAHRTTGVALAGEDESAFTKVHDPDFLQAKKRLYMTATPRLYSDDTKSKAAQADAVLCSMDDPKLYGEEIYRIGFGEAVSRDLLTDYKVLILTLSDQDVPPAVQKMIAGQESEINTDDASKLIGCVNALSKKVLGDAGIIKESDPEPMRRALAFCRNIEESKKITANFMTATDSYINSLPDEKKEQMVSVASQHIDGTMTAPQRDELLGWLKAETENNECRVLTNVRCLSEGVDVPSLDAVMFLSARNSQVDVVQSVGRVMRKAPGKKYGYIIIPVVVPSNVEADKALDDNDRYKVVWTVLNALRAHDDRFNATVNKIELNKHRPEQIIVGRPEYAFTPDGLPTVAEDPAPYGTTQQLANQLMLQFEQLQNVVFARMVQKVGDRRYWEQWAKNVAEIAERQAERIHKLINEDTAHREAFAGFLNGLKKNINPSITQHEAVEMLSQHIITKPVFEALFEGYSFVNNNPISVSMQTMLDLLEGGALEKDTETLQKFYESVKMRASNIDNAEGKQRIIIELYDKFFKTAFPKMVERLGIVYTPVEVVDFIIHSVNDVLKKEFGRSISDENVHVLDPFTGTGTFITRLLQSGLIDKKDLERKFKQELHANEIVLLAYYIAAVNIENAFHDQLEENQEYQSFEGIVLTDTFQLDEVKTTQYGTETTFSRNFERIMSQKNAPLRVIMGNPPYSVGQKSANDNAQNQAYPKLDARIAATYAKATDATNKNSLYDSYIKAFRWSTDRLDKNGGIVCFVSNGAWLDGNSADGFRKSLENEFSAIYVFNLRGNARTSGELRQKEAGNVFGGGSRTPISITLLVKNPAHTGKKAIIHYHDIGDYLNREEKLALVKKFKSVGNAEMPWKQLTPNDHGDWVNERNDAFGTFIPIQSEKKFDLKAKVFFVVNSRGNESSRDTWVYNSSLSLLKSNMEKMVSFYNQQVDDFNGAKPLNPKVNDFINVDPRNISWTSSLILQLEKGNRAVFEQKKTAKGLYRPFFKQNVYLGEKMIHRRGQMNEFFPTPSNKNFVICISGIGDSKNFTVIITDIIPDVQLQFNGQVFPLYYYEERQKQTPGLFDASGESEYTRRDGLSDFILDRAKKQYGKNVSKEDIFYYVYGFLHSPTYRTLFANDLKKMLPRLPLVEDVRDFWKFSKAGRALADLHLNYESVPAYPGVTVTGAESGFYKVEKMRFPKKGQKDCILYNSKITLENIPAKAYDYTVNGKSAIDWVMERYQVTTHKDSGIKNDPNDWADEVGNPRYILDLLLSVINVSVQTADIVEELPQLEF